MKTLPRQERPSRACFFAGIALLLSGAAHADESVAAATPQVQADSAIDAGRYLVTIGGCNDCHTSGWAETGGAVPESEMLTGLPVGWRGPWGTTYASNLRLLVSETTEEAWVTMLRHRTARPPMPWMNVAKLSDSDARAMYRYIQSLGAAGERMPAAVDPGVEPTTPYFLFEPLAPKSMNTVTSNQGAPTQ